MGRRHGESRHHGHLEGFLVGRQLHIHLQSDQCKIRLLFVCDYLDSFFIGGGQVLDVDDVVEIDHVDDRGQGRLLLQLTGPVF